MSARLDPLVAWLLTTAALAGWWATFAGVGWLLWGAAAAGAGAVLVTLHARTRTLGWAFLTLPVGYGLLALAALGGRPSDGWGALVTGTWRCWPLLVHADPPVEATGTVLLAPLSAGLLVAAVATALARSRARPGWPVLPLLALLTWVLVTGAEPSWSAGLYGATYGLACLAWAGLRAARDTGGRPPDVRWATAAPLLVLCALAAIPLGTDVVRGQDHGRLVLRDRAETVDVAPSTGGGSSGPVPVRPRGGRPSAAPPTSQPHSQGASPRPTTAPTTGTGSAATSAAPAGGGPGAWWALLLLPVAAASVPAWKASRRARRRRAPRPSQRYVGAWEEVVDRARDLGLAVPRRRSRPAQAEALGAATDLARTADDAVFGPASPTLDAADAYWAAALDARTRLASGLPAWRRWWAPFSVASLRRT